MTPIVKKYFAAAAMMLIGAAAAFSQAPERPMAPADQRAVEDVFLARDDGSGDPGDTVTSFFATDIPIHCIVQLADGKAATVKMVFVAVEVAGVKPESKVVTTVYTTKENEDRVNFTGRPYDKWHPGKYRVDIFVNGKLAKGVDFDIRPASGSVDGAAYLAPKRKAVRPKKQ